MEALIAIIEALTAVSLVVAVVTTYLKINKLWDRKHIPDVASSVSVAACLMSLVVIVPFLLKFLVVEHDYVAASKYLLSLVLCAMFFLVGIGAWVSREPRGLWVRVLDALHLERLELTTLVRSIGRPREATTAVQLLRSVAWVDGHLDLREQRIIESVARQRGVHREGIWFLPPQERFDIAAARRGLVDYLALRPDRLQVGRMWRLVRLMADAEGMGSPRVHLVLDELHPLVRRYLDEGAELVPRYEVLVVPQHPGQEEEIGRLLGGTAPVPRAGGLAFLEDTYFTARFAEAVGSKYRHLGYFCTVQPAPSA